MAQRYTKIYMRHTARKWGCEERRGSEYFEKWVVVEKNNNGRGSSIEKILPEVILWIREVNIA